MIGCCSGGGGFIYDFENTALARGSGHAKILRERAQCSQNTRHNSTVRKADSSECQ